MTVHSCEQITVLEWSFHFVNDSQLVIYDIVTEKLCYKNLCARHISTMLTNIH